MMVQCGIICVVGNQITWRKPTWSSRWRQPSSILVRSEWITHSPYNNAMSMTVDI